MSAGTSWIDGTEGASKLKEKKRKAPGRNQGKTAGEWAPRSPLTLGNNEPTSQWSSGVKKGTHKGAREFTGGRGEDHSTRRESGKKSRGQGWNPTSNEDQLTSDLGGKKRRCPSRRTEEKSVIPAPNRANSHWESGGMDESRPGKSKKKGDPRRLTHRRPEICHEQKGQENSAKWEKSRCKQGGKGGNT